MDKSNLFTSSITQPIDNLLEILIDRISLVPIFEIEVFKYSENDVLIGLITPSMSDIDNAGCPEDKTRIRVFLNEGQVAAGEKLQIKLNTVSMV